jgi:hypothetical protein
MNAMRFIVSMVPVLVTVQASVAQEKYPLCTRWSEPVRVGELDVATIMEASGLAISRDGKRLYHINDGDIPAFFVTDAEGGRLRQVRVAGFTPLDMEDMGYGRCGQAQCLFLADTGDNAVRREHVQIAVVPEADEFAGEVNPLRVVTARFPDGPHDVEAIAIHPDGNLLLATKSRIGIGGPSQLFRLASAQLDAGGEQTFELLGEIPVPALTSRGLPVRRVVTSMDISPDGRRLMLLTYDLAFEIALDPQQLLPGKWTEGGSHRALDIAPLVQAEAIAYDRDGRSILYSTESVRGTAAPLMRQQCME